MTIEQLKKMLADIPDEETTEETQVTTENNAENSENPTTPEETTGTSEIEPLVEEETEIIAPEIEKDVTIITSEGMVQESTEMRLASFYTKLTQLESDIKEIVATVMILQKNFSDIEKAIDTASETSPTVENMSDLINQIL
jgi:hypothetical protein